MYILVWTVNSSLSWGCKISEFHIFAPPNAAPCTVPPGADAPPSRRHWTLFLDVRLENADLCERARKYIYKFLVFYSMHLAAMTSQLHRPLQCNRSTVQFLTHDHLVMSASGQKKNPRIFPPRCFRRASSWSMIPPDVVNTRNLHAHFIHYNDARSIQTRCQKQKNMLNGMHR